MTNINVAKLNKKYGLSEGFILGVFDYIKSYGVNDATLTLALVLEYEENGFDKSIAKVFIETYKKCN